MVIFRNIILFTFLFISFHVNGQSVEYFVKASFIEKFARFTRWEPNSIGENFIIGVLGVNPFHSELEKLSKKTTIKGKPVKIMYFTDLQETRACHVLFICSSEKNNLTTIIKYLETRNILLVSDTPGFAEKGVHFNFYYKLNETLHFEINMKSLVKANLKTDIQLLSLGKIIN